MDRNASESPSRMKNFYSAYMEGMNKKIADLKSSKNADQFDAVPLDPQFQNLEGDPLDYGAQIANEIFSVEEDSTGDPTRIAEDKDLQEDMERSLLNQYSLLEDPDLADTLLDDTEETDLSEAINPESDAVQNYEEEFINTYGKGSVPFEMASKLDSDYADRRRAEGDPDYLEGGIFDYDKSKPGVQSFYDNRYEGYPSIPSYLRDSVLREIPISYQQQSNLPYEFIRDKGIAGGRETYDTAFQDVPVNIPADAFSDVRSSLLPKAASIIPQQFKDGGSVNTYDVLKLINDTMNDG